PRAQDLLRRALDRRWLTGEPGAGFTFAQFESLAEVCSPFAEPSQLIELLARSEAPRSWRDPALRRWLRRQRTAAADAPWSARLLAPALPQSPGARLDRYAFLLDLLEGAPRQIEAVRSHFAVAAWETASPTAIAAYVAGLASLEQSGGSAG